MRLQPAGSTATGGEKIAVDRRVMWESSELDKEKSVLHSKSACSLWFRSRLRFEARNLAPTQSVLSKDRYKKTNSNLFRIQIQQLHENHL
jgi:hypothetical protein